MKNSIKMLLTLAVFLMSFSFANAQAPKKVNMKKPDQVALAFMQRFMEFDFEGAKALTTEESHQMFSFLEMALGMSGEEEMAKAKEEAKVAAKNLKKATCTKTKEDATCTICCDENNQNLADSEIKLKKVKGKWYVNMSKEDMGVPAEEEVAPEEGE